MKDSTSIPTPELKTLLIGELTGLTAKGPTYRAGIIRKRDEVIQSLTNSLSGTVIDKADGFLILFDRPGQAVQWALSFIQQWQVNTFEFEDVRPRFGLHLGEVYLRSNSPEDIERGAKPLEVEGLSKPMTARLMVLAQGNQILLTRGAFDIARRSAQDADEADLPLSWLAHGGYLFKGLDEPVDVFEVGIIGQSPLCQPTDTEKAKKASGEANIVGWRPAQAQEIPHRHHWFLDRKLGEGGFGEVWLAKHAKTGDLRVFKFCFERERLKGLQREVTLFRLLKIGLGSRNDITRILDWNFEEAPYFIESQYTKGGNLKDWIASRGGLDQIDWKLKCQLAAQIAEALSAAHSVGILHKDIKPANVLIQETGRKIQAQLTDFGIGMLEDRERLKDANITVLGFTKTAFDTEYSGGGTQKYMAPELLEGKTPSHHSDLFALGVLIYQLFCGDFGRALGPGWERDIQQALLREDLSKLLDKNPKNRPGDAKEVSLWFRDFECREQERCAQLEATKAKKDLERSRKRRKVYSLAAGVIFLFAIAMAFQANRVAHEAERANQEAQASREIADFMTGIFKVSDPNRGDQVTAQELLDASARDLNRKLANQPRIKARLSEAIGTAYLNLGRYKEAGPLLEQAQQGYETLYGMSSPEMFSLLEKLARLLSRTGQTDKALAMLSEIQDSKKALYSEDSKEQLSTIRALFEVCQSGGRFGDALIYKKELDRLEKRWETGSSPEPRFLSQSESPLELVNEVPLPPDIAKVLGRGPYPGSVLAMGMGTLYVIDMNQKRPLEQIPLLPDERAIDQLKNGKIILNRKGQIRLRDVFNPNSPEDEIVTEGLLSEDQLVSNYSGSRFAVCSGRNITVLAKKGRSYERLLQFTLEAPPAPIFCLTERYFGCFDSSLGGKGVHIFDLETGKKILSAKHWQGRPFSLAIDDLTTSFLVAGWFDEIFLYNINKPQPQIIVSTHTKKGRPVLFPDHATYALGGEENLTIANHQTGLKLTHKRSGSQLEPIEYGAEGLLVMDRTRRSLLQFHYQNCKIDEQIPVSNSQIWATAATPDGRFVFTGGADGSLQRYDRKGNRIDSLSGHTQGVTAILPVSSIGQFRPNWIVSASDDKSLILWDHSTQSILKQTKAHAFLVNDLFWEEGSQMLWSASSDQFIKGWSLPDLEEQSSFKAGKDSNADLWIDSIKGRALVGKWGGDWLALEKREEEWVTIRRVETGCRGIYKLIELEELGLVLMMGLNPDTIWLYDTSRDLAWPLKTPDLEYSCATAVGVDTIALGGWGLAIYKFKRDGDRIHYQTLVQLNSNFGLLTGAAFSPEDQSLAFGNYRGKLIIVKMEPNSDAPLLDEWLEPEDG